MRFSADEPLAQARCSFDGGAARACSSGDTFTFPEGQHTVAVTGTDLNGRAGTSAARTFDVIDTALGAGPDEGSIVSTPDASFVLSTVHGTGFDCRLDGLPIQCGGAQLLLSRLSDGRHTLSVRATRGAAADAIPATRSWTVDTVAPRTTLDPDTLAFDADEPATFRCALDGAAPAPCTAPPSRDALAPGRHVFAVAAVDRAGNVDPTPETATFTIAALVQPAPTPPVATPEPPAATPAPPVATPEPAAATPAPPAVTAQPRAATPKLAFALRFTFRADARATRFSRLSAAGLPSGTKVKVAFKCPVRKGCPKAFTRTAKASALSLSPLLGKALRPSTRVTITASRPGALSATKVLTLRANRAPVVRG